MALVVTFGAAALLQGMAENRTVSSEPFVIDKIRPAATVTRGPSERERERGGRSLILVSGRQADG